MPSFNQGAASRTVLRLSQRGPFPRIISIGGLRFVLERGVFSPEQFWSTRIFTNLLPLVPGGSFLEIGCGAGVTSVVAALQGASRTVAADINPAAVHNTLLNADLHGVGERLSSIRSNVFDGLQTKDRFDAIYWNLPFIWQATSYRYKSMLERSLFDPGYTYTNRFLRQAKGRLTEVGRLFVGFADFGDRARLDSLARRWGYQVVELGTGYGIEGRDVEFQMLELERCASTGV